MGASSNFGNMFSMLGASYLLPFLLMLPIQILLNNLLYDFSQTGIPSDNVDEELIVRPRKWDITNIKWFMIFIGPISSIFDYATFGLMWFVFNGRAFLTCRRRLPPVRCMRHCSRPGGSFESLLTQTLIVHIIRTKRIPFIQSRASLPMTLTTLGVMAIRSLVALLSLCQGVRLYSIAAELLGMDRVVSPDLQRINSLGKAVVL